MKITKSKTECNYRCHCHAGRCPLHEEANDTRKEFIRILCRILGFDNTIEPYDSDRHMKARRILHLADWYVNRAILNSNITLE